MGSNPLIGTLFMYGAIGAIFYFILLRPQQKQRKEHDAMIKSLRKGDEVVTAGGVVGEVVFIAQPAKEGGETKPAAADDRITIKSGDTRLVIERGRIAKITRHPSNTSAT